METKIGKFAVKAVADQGEVTAVIATKGVKDKDGDVTLDGAFGWQTAHVIPGHNWKHVPIGKATVRETAREAVADLQFNMDLDSGREWFRAIKFDFEKGSRPLQQFSYGFDIEDSEYGQWKGEKVRLLKKVKIHEVSPVLLGAGVNTRTVAVKRHQVPHLEKIRNHAAAICLKSDFRRIKERMALSDAVAECRATLDRCAERYLETSHVSPEQRDVASKTLTQLADCFGLEDVPPPRWFSPESHKEWLVRRDWGGDVFEGFKFPTSGLAGAAIGEQVWLRNDLVGDELIEVCIHELGHIWQPQATEREVENLTTRIFLGD